MRLLIRCVLLLYNIFKYRYKRSPHFFPTSCNIFDHMAVKMNMKVKIKMKVLSAVVECTATVQCGAVEY